MSNYEMETPRYKPVRRKSQPSQPERRKPQIESKEQLIGKIQAKTAHLVYTSEEQKEMYQTWVGQSLQGNAVVVDVDSDFSYRKMSNPKNKYLYRCTHIPSGMSTVFTDRDGYDNHIHAAHKTLVILEEHVQDWKKLRKLDPAVTPQQFLYPNHQT